MSDNPDGRAILASLPACMGLSAEELDIPLAAIPCLRFETLHPTHEGLWVA